MALQFVPEEKHTPELYLMAVQQNGQACSMCLKINALSSYALRRFRPYNRMASACVMFLKTSALLSYVLLPFNIMDRPWSSFPKASKENIIQELSIVTILKNNYLSRQYFPNAFTEKIKQYLHSIDYIVVNNSPEVYEVGDAQLTYIHNKQNKNKTVFPIASTNATVELNQLLQDLSKANNPKLHLVLIGHSTEDAIQLAGLDVKDIVDICANHKNIQDIHLLGCNAAKARKPEKERKMLEILTEKMQKYRYGLITAVNQTNSTDFQKKCLKFCQKNALDGVYVINKKENGDYELFSMKYDKQKQTITGKVREIPQKHVSVQILKAGGQRILFDNWEMKFNKKQMLPGRGKNNPLSFQELTQIRGLVDTVERFEKTHPKYKKDKTMYPFLAKVEAVFEDLEPSLLKRIADELRANDKINWDITLHGPTKALHVDTTQKNFKVTKTHLYSNDYSSSLFFSGKPIIDYEKLKNERRQEIKQESKKTRAKQLKITIKPKSPSA